MDFFGIEIDEEKNNIRAKELTEIQSDKAKIKILVIPTDEEVEIAKQSYELLN
jgi:acetate kinase